MDKPISTLAKLLLLGAGGLAVIAGPVLFFLPSDTGTYFAWAIKHPLTPVFMGANYFGGVGALWAFRTNRWAVARVLFPGIIVFGTTQLLATALHAPSFNWNHPIAWAWLLVYVSSPVLALVAYVGMERRDKQATPPATPIPEPWKPLALLFAVSNGLIGVALWLSPAVVPASAPGGAAPWWAWSLTPLTARVIGGWYLAAATLFAVLSCSHPPKGMQVAALGVICATGLELVGAFQYRSVFNGPAPSIALYLLNAAGAFTFAIYSFLKSRRLALTASPRPVDFKPK